MRYFILLALVGFAAAASIYDASSYVEDEASRGLTTFMDLVHLDDFQFAAEGGENEEPSELEKKLREKFEEALEKIKDAIEKGKEVKQDALDKVKKLREQLKELNVKISEKGKELLKKIGDKAREWLQKLLDKLGNKEKRAESIKEDLKGLFQKFKKAIRDLIDEKVIKEKIEKLFGKGSEIAVSLIEKLKEKGGHGKQKILDFIDRFLEDKREERSLREMWEKVKECFDKIKIAIQEKYMKFGYWVKENVAKLLDHAKDKNEKIQTIAKEFIAHIKDVSKDVAAEGLEFLRPYKEDLGSLWDQLKDSVKEILNKKD